MAQFHPQATWKSDRSGKAVWKKNAANRVDAALAKRVLHTKTSQRIRHKMPNGEITSYDVFVVPQTDGYIHYAINADAELKAQEERKNSSRRFLKHLPIYPLV